MPSYGNYSGSGTGSGNGGDYNDTTLKLQTYSAIRGTLTDVRAYNGNYGDQFITAWDDVFVTDGIVFQRDDDPDTWKVFGFEDLGFELTEDGRLVTDADGADDDDGLSAQDILDHARVRGFSETFGGDTYWYTPVGVVIEDEEDIAVNDEIEFETPEVQSPEIPVGEVSMMLSNSSWVRTLAKLTTAEGSGIIETEENEDGVEVASSEDFGWLTTLEPTIRDSLEGRELHLFIIEDSFTPDDSDEAVTFRTPVILDAKTGHRVTLDNDGSQPAGEDSEEAGDGETEADAEPAEAATDGGATTESSGGSESETASPNTSDAAGGLPEDVPEVLDDIIDYFGRTDGEDTTAEDVRDFAEDEVEDVEAVNWEAAAAEAHSRA